MLKCLEYGIVREIKERPPPGPSSMAVGYSYRFVTDLYLALYYITLTSLFNDWNHKLFKTINKGDQLSTINYQLSTRAKNYLSLNVSLKFIKMQTFVSLSNAYWKITKTLRMISFCWYESAIRNSSLTDKNLIKTPLKNEQL